MEVLADRVERERCTDELREAEREELEAPEVGDALQVDDLLADEPVPVLARPAPRGDLRAGEERLLESTEDEEVAERGGALQLQLRGGERVKAEEVVAALERVPAVSVEVEAGARLRPLATAIFDRGQEYLRVFSTTVENTRAASAPYATIPCPSTASERACRSRNSRTRRSMTRNQRGGIAASQIIPA